MIAAGSDVPQRMTGLLESELLRTRCAILVTDAEVNPRVHPQLREVTKVTSYVAAPLVSYNVVVGILHADQNVTTGIMDMNDQVVLGTFCEGLGIALERVLLMEQIASIRTRVHDQVFALEHLVDQQPESESSAIAGHSVRHSDRPDDLGASNLTRRENEVLILLGAGLTNADIAERLYIAEGTVKSHLKSVFSKLGAANRAEAIVLSRQRMTMRL